MKIFTIVGTRPNFIKIDKQLEQTIVHTGQHYDYEMSKAFFEDLSLPEPKFNLECTGNEFGRMYDKLKKLFNEEKPDMVIVFGDTLSSLAGAMAAAFTKTKLTHIESGLRSFTNMPEEVCRVLIDRLATIRICPNAYSEMNLIKEGLNEHNYVIGDPSFETLGSFLPIPKSKDYRKYNLLTLHRDFNADSEERLRAIFKAIADSGEKFVFPVHPRTLKNMRKFKIKLPKNVRRVKPQKYGDTLSLISNANKVITDSGGIQREAFWFNVPVIILRAETEWLDIIQKGGGVLVGADYIKLLESIRSFNGRINSPPEPGVNAKIREVIYKYL